MKNSQKYEPKCKPDSVFADVRGVRYHILEWGDRDKPPLVLLHGWGDCAASFQFLVDELQQDRFVVAPDWRGFGRSHNRGNGYWFPDYIADLDVLLTHYLEDAPARLLGHSMGANVAGLFAGIFPERVASFINVEGFGLADGDPANAPENYRRWITESRTMPAYAEYKTFEALAARILKRNPAMSPDRARYVAEQWAVRRDDGAIELRADPAHKLPNAVLYRRAEAEACWREVTADVLLVVGEDTDFTAAAKSWIDPDESAHPFRNEKTAVIPGCGHMVHFEQPARLASAVEEFLGTDPDAIV
jgi:pimeloyl-ACP methyl ester carboxylesterase